MCYHILKEIIDDHCENSYLLPTPDNQLEILSPLDKLLHGGGLR